MRMTQVSRNNLLVASSVMVEAMGGCFVVRVEHEGKVAYVNSADGIVLYPTQLAAVRAVKRLRSDLPITSF